MTEANDRSDHHPTTRSAAAGAHLLDGVALVTGAASGIGEQVALQLAGAGVGVAVLDRDAAGAQRVADRVGGIAVVADVADSAAVDAATAMIEADHGPLRYLVNNAGVGNLKRFEHYTDREIDLIWKVNVTGTYICTRAVAPRIRANGGGAIVNVASVSGVRPTMGEAPYSAAKAAVIALASSTALEFAPTVRANAVSPGFVRTPLNEMVAGDDELRGSIEAGTPAGRIGNAEETAQLIVYLLSDAAGFITGQNFVLDGGSLINSAQMDATLGTMLSRFG